MIMHQSSYKKSHRGFTFIELLMSVALLALLVGMAFPMLKIVVQREKEQQLREALMEIRTAIDAYKYAATTGRIEISLEESGYPKSLSQLVEGSTDRRSPSAAKMYFLRRIPADPMYAGSPLAAEQTWGLRSYASPPDDPQAGIDVYDVYSLSDEVGLNGVPYRDW